MANSSSRHNLSAFQPILIFLALIWVVQIINFFMDYNLNGWLGLSPRRSSGLVGILFCPFLHANFKHAALNSAPLMLMGGMILGINRRAFLPATAIIMLIGGFLTWIVGSPYSVHVGASGVVFGFLGFLVAYGLFAKKIVAIIGAIMAAVMYGYMIDGVLPSGPGVSWEGHAFGLLGGIVAAYVLRKY